jgi:hypothetical protein
MKEYLSIAIVLCSLIGCTETKKDIKPDNGTNIVYQVDTENTSTFHLDEIADLASVVPLETTSDNLIGEIKEVFLTDSLIIIWDSKMRNILVFNKDGRYKYNIGRRGSAAGEYAEIRDVYVEGSRVYVSDLPTQRILTYDISGKFIKSDNFGYHLYSFYPTEAGYWGANANQNDGKFELIFVEKKSQKIEYGFFPCEAHLMPQLDSNFSQNETTGDVFFHSRYDNVIYKIEDKNVIPYIKIDFGAATIPYTREKEPEKLNEVLFNNSLDYTGQIHNVYAYDDKLFLSFYKYYKGTNRIDGYEAYISLNENNMIVYNPVDIVYPGSDNVVEPDPAIIGLSQGKLIYQINPGSIPEILLTKLKVYSSELSFDSNPVLFLYDLDKK